MSDLTSNFFLHNSRGKLAGAVLGVRKGRTIMREDVKPSNPQTHAQMVRRVKWGNLVNVHRILAQAGVMANAWENKPSNWTDYNALMSANPCDENNLNWLEKDQARTGFITAKSAILVAKGTLPSIVANYNASQKSFITSIAFDPEAVEEVETLGDWWAAVIASNEHIHAMDELTFVSITQTIGEDGKPVQSVIVESHIVDPTTTEEMADDTIMSTNQDNTALTFDATYATLGATVTEFGFVVHSRKSDTGVKVSTARMTQGGYSLPNTLEEAIESYSGEEAAAFLDPTN